MEWIGMNQENSMQYTELHNPRKDWAKDVSDEHGNYEFLMFANLDHTNTEVRADIFKWAEWIGTELAISGMRIDAAKHYSTAFQKEFVGHLWNTVSAEYFLVGEYWREDVRHLLNYLKAMEYGVSLFDVPLLGRFALTS
jgi:alpha-amylase